MRSIFAIFIFIILISINKCWQFINHYDNDDGPSIKQKCLQYVVDSNIHAGDLVMMVHNSTGLNNLFVRRTMATTNVVMAVAYHHPPAVHQYPSNESHSFSFHQPYGGKPIRRYPIKNDISNDFQHKYGIVGFYIIETSAFMIDHVIEFISRTNGYNSRANFILVITDSVDDDDDEDGDGNDDDDDSETETPPLPFRSVGPKIPEPVAAATTTAASLSAERPTFQMETENWINDDNGTTKRTSNHERRRHHQHRHVAIRLQQIFRSLWRYYIFNSVVIACDKTDLKVCSVYTWFPFDRGSHCGNNMENFIRIDQCVVDANDDDDGNDGDDINDDGNNGNNGYDFFSVRYNNMMEHHHQHYVHIRIKNDCEQLENIDRPEMDELELQTQRFVNASLHLSVFNNKWKQSPRTKRINTCHNRPMAVLKWMRPPMPAAAASASASLALLYRIWDKKYTRQFFNSNYKPYGLIEFRQWPDTVNVSSTQQNSTSPNEYQLFTKSNIRTRNAMMRRPPQLNKRQRHHRQPHNEQRTIHDNRRPHFYEKIPNDLGGCKFHGLLFIWPPFVTPATATFYGLEHKLMLDVARLMNFRLVEEYVEIQNLADSNTKSDQLYQMLLDSDVAVLGFGNVYPNVRMHSVIDHSIGYLYDLVNWVVPLAGNKPVWLNLVNCFR